MGAVGLNGATAKAKNPRERLSLASLGWAKWAPVQLAAIIVHGVGGAGLIWGNKQRLMKQGESRTNTVVKLIVTGLAGASTLYSAILGMKMAKHAEEGTGGVTEPNPLASGELRAAENQQKVLQCVIPALTGIAIILAAQQGEQQRPVAGWLQSKSTGLLWGKR